MRQQILNLFTTPRDMSWEDILLNIVLAAVLGFFIFLSYAISHRGTIYSRKFNASLVILTVLTGTVMTVIGNNIALSLGMVGAPTAASRSRSRRRSTSSFAPKRRCVWKTRRRIRSN